MEQLEQLKDIRGLEQGFWWPLAVGWWVIVALIIIAAITVLAIHKIKENRRHSWQASALIQLEKLRNNMADSHMVGDFFELLKEVAIIKFGRKKCAHLTGVSWLNWLTENDKNNFDWFKYGRELIEIQYAPDNVVKKALETEEIKNDLQQISNALKNLIKNRQKVSKNV